MKIQRFFSLLLLSLLCFLPLSPSFALETGVKAPDFELKDLDGNSVSLSSYAGRPVILKLATTWCPTCRMMTEELTEIASRLAELNVTVVEVFLQDSESMVRDFFRGKSFRNLNHVALLDDGRVVKACDVYLIPRTLFLDAELKVVRDAGMVPGRDILRQIEEMVSVKEK